MNCEEYIKLKDAQQVILDYIGSKKFQEHLDNCYADEEKHFTRGAMWGLAMAATIININCERYSEKE